MPLEQNNRSKILLDSSRTESIQMHSLRTLNLISRNLLKTISKICKPLVLVNVKILLTNNTITPRKTYYFQKSLGFENIQCNIYRNMCQGMGLLENDKDWQSALMIHLNLLKKLLLLYSQLFHLLATHPNPLHSSNENKEKFLEDILNRY